MTDNATNTLDGSRIDQGDQDEIEKNSLVHKLREDYPKGVEPGPKLSSALSPAQASIHSGATDEVTDLG